MTNKRTTHDKPQQHNTNTQINNKGQQHTKKTIKKNTCVINDKKQQKTTHETHMTKQYKANK